MQRLTLRWESLVIKHKRVIDDDDEDCEDNVEEDKEKLVKLS